MTVRIDIEKELAICITAMGGHLIDDKKTANESIKADYWFPNANVVGELKCLTEDYFNDTTFNDWLQSQYDDWVKRGLAKKTSGRAFVNLKELPSICTSEVTSFLRKRLEGSIKKANLQIKQSRKDLNAESALGLLILVNDGNSAVPAGMVESIIARSLPNKFSAIHSIIHFTANMPSELPGIDKDLLFWCEWNVGRVRTPVPAELIDQIRVAWLAHHSNISGALIPTISGSETDLYNLTFIGR